MCCRVLVIRFLKHIMFVVSLFDYFVFIEHFSHCITWYLDLQTHLKILHSIIAV